VQHEYREEKMMQWTVDRRVTGMLVGMLIVLLAGCGGGLALPTPPHVALTPLASPALIHYTDPQGRFSFDRPAAWQVVSRRVPRIAVQFTSSVSYGAFSVGDEPLPAGMDIDRYVAETIAALDQSLIGFQSGELARSPTIDFSIGDTSRTIDFLSVGKSGTQYGIQTIVVRGQTAYVFDRTILADHATDTDPFLIQADAVIRTLSFA
jgi:hypothetical protein